MSALWSYDCIQDAVNSSGDEVVFLSVIVGVGLRSYSPVLCSRL